MSEVLQVPEPTKETRATAEALSARTNQLFNEQQVANCRQVDRLFAWLMAFQWLACVITALLISPRAWEGTASSIHIHVWTALLVGGFITLFPISLAILRPGKMYTRHVIAASQMLMSALLIHLSGGRIETHFHVFGSIAFLSFYRDWRVLLTASLMVALDHGIRGLFWPFSVYGNLTVEPWRWLEHTGWVVFMDMFCLASIYKSNKALWDVAFRRSELEKMNEIIEAKVVERTSELQSEIAERIEAEEELEATNERLKDMSLDLERSRDQAIQASRFKSEFLANMSHEIRTPLNAVVGMSDLLLRTRLTDEQREFSTVINHSADVLLGIVNDILDYSKIESGRLDLEIIDFDLVEMVEGAAELVSERARSKQLSLATYIDPSLPRLVRGDSGRIRQVIINFLANSIKFTDRGEIIIRAVRKSEEAGEVGIRFTVSDTGIGLSESAREKLFQPFTQADASFTRKYGGTGLGLAISKRLVELMGGEIEFNSVYGEGSEFGFVIDLGISSDRSPPSLVPPDDVRDARILLVDGPAGAQQVLNSYIASWGMRCSAATDVDKACLMLRREAAANDPFDLVMVAFDPGNAEPLALLREISNRSQLSNTKCIVIGASVDKHFGRQALKDGFSAYLPMPVRQSKLFDCIINLLQAKSANQPNTQAEISSEQLSAVAGSERCNLILVVEDNAINQKVTLLQLRELGLAAHAVANGREALEAVARTQYALILMDCQMPEMDGFQATKEIRKLESRTGKHSPIIALTAHAMTSDRLECLAAGMDDYISKPVSQKKLAEVVKRWMPRDAGKSMSEADPGRQHTDPRVKPVELDVLFSTFGEDLIADLLVDYVAEADSRLLDLDRAVEDQDFHTIKNIVHDLKGSSATIYATELAEISAALEEFCLKEDFTWESMPERLEALKQAWSRVRAFLAENGYHAAVSTKAEAE